MKQTINLQKVKRKRGTLNEWTRLPFLLEDDARIEKLLKNLPLRMPC